jgi:dUTP pyrophosphatase
MWNPLDGLPTVNVGFRKLHPDAKIPTYGSDEAAGADLYALDKWLIHPRSRSSMALRTGIAIQLPKGFEAQVRPRSGLALKHGITVLNTPGTIDSDYRGELSVILYNTSQAAFMVHAGDRIAQLVIVPVFRARFQELNELGLT